MTIKTAMEFSFHFAHFAANSDYDKIVSHTELRNDVDTKLINFEIVDKCSLHTLESRKRKWA